MDFPKRLWFSDSLEESLKWIRVKFQTLYWNKMVTKGYIHKMKEILQSLSFVPIVSIFVPEFQEYSLYLLSVLPDNFELKFINSNLKQTLSNWVFFFKFDSHFYRGESKEIQILNTKAAKWTSINKTQTIQTHVVEDNFAGIKNRKIARIAEEEMDDDLLILLNSVNDNPLYEDQQVIWIIPNCSILDYKGLYTIYQEEELSNEIIMKAM